MPSAPRNIGEEANLGQELFSFIDAALEYVAQEFARALSRARLLGHLLGRKQELRVSRFIDPFLRWFTKSTDAPLEFGTAAALYTLSTISLSRKWIAGTDHIHPNLFCMIVGDSSVARKSTSVKRARAMVDEVDPNRIGPSDYTVEGLYTWMLGKDHTTGKGRSKVALFAGEFGADLARMENYAKTVQADFCHLYDGELIEKVRAGGKTLRIEKPRVNLLAAAAYPMLSRYLGPKDWMSGYLMRFIFVAPLVMRPENAVPPPPALVEYDAAKNSLQVLRDDLVASPSGLTIDPAALKLYARSRTYHRMRLEKTTHIVTTYLARFWTNILKLALLYQVDDDLHAPIGYTAMQKAVTFGMDVCWPSFTATFERTATKDFESMVMLVSGIITAAGAGGISRSTLAHRFLGSRELPEVIGWLKSGKLIACRITMSGDGQMDEILVWR